MVNKKISYKLQVFCFYSNSTRLACFVEEFIFFCLSLIKFLFSNLEKIYVLEKFDTTLHLKYLIRTTFFLYAFRPMSPQDYVLL